jgi:hypothetical protein
MKNIDIYNENMLYGMQFIIEKRLLDCNLNSYDYEFSKIFNCSNQIFSSFDRLRTISRLIEIVPSRSFFEERELQEDEYLKYNIESYLVCTISLLDRLSTFLNICLELKIKEKDCSFIKLVNKYDDKLPKSIATKLSEIHLATKNLRKNRNIVVHDGEFDDENWFMLSGLLMMRRTQSDFKYEKQLNGEIEKAYEKYFVIMNDNNKIVFNFIYEILEITIPNIQKKYELAIENTEENIKAQIFKVMNEKSNNFR